MPSAPTSHVLSPAGDAARDALVGFCQQVFGQVVWRAPRRGEKTCSARWWQKGTVLRCSDTGVGTYALRFLAKCNGRESCTAEMTMRRNLQFNGFAT